MKPEDRPPSILLRRQTSKSISQYTFFPWGSFMLNMSIGRNFLLLQCFCMIFSMLSSVHLTTISNHALLMHPFFFQQKIIHCIIVNGGIYVCIKWHIILPNFFGRVPALRKSWRQFSLQIMLPAFVYCSSLFEIHIYTLTPSLHLAEKDPGRHSNLRAFDQTGWWLFQGVTGCYFSKWQ